MPLDDSTRGKTLTPADAEPCVWRVEKDLDEVKARILPRTENKEEGREPGEADLSPSGGLSSILLLKIL